MKEERIIAALGKVKGSYIMEAAPGRTKAKKHSMRWIAAVAAVFLTLLFLQTAPGAAAVEIVKETVTELIETLFPPKEITIAPEGMPAEIPYVADGKEPQIQEDGAVSVPGFAMYIDPEHYVMTEENGVTYVRPITFSENLPACEIEIVHLPDMLPLDAAESVRAEMTGNWESISEITSRTNGFYFSASGGSEWDSPQADLYFLEDGQQGTFHLTVRYFLEATEGHGVRFWTMVDTFEVIAP